ncbi:MAG: tetratricopeptide repeat protein [Hyphomonadaceae bacterium]
MKLGMLKGRLLAGAALTALLFTTASLAPAPNAATEDLRTLVFSRACGPAEGLARREALGRLLAGAAAYAQTIPGALDTPPPLMSGLGDAHMDITTASPQAQAYFDQGLRLLHAFNHAEAIRAFREAQRIDPTCAMCFWGESFAYGPNINAPMNPADNEVAFNTSRAAFERMSNATPLEQGMIEALQVRYTRIAPENRTGLDAAYADAMAAVADRFADSDIAQVMAAEAAMDTQPWNYWNADGRETHGRAGDAIARVERVLARSPRNAGAIHLYIHLAEASIDPWRAEAAAERLAAVAPAAGHLVHMPGHIFYRVGRFRESLRLNVSASAADEAYIRNASPSPIYRYGYYPHNLHFVMTSAAMAGDARTALDYANRLDEALPHEMAAQVVLAQPVRAAPWFARAQFDTPANILAAEAPAPGIAYVSAAHHYARGMAFARTGRPAETRAEAQAIATLASTADFSMTDAQGIPAREILRTYASVLEARALMAERNYTGAIAELERAVAMQAEIAYTEPPYIYYPIRRTLGAAYLLNRQPARAEMEFLQTLIESPQDAYAYWGIAEARRQRGDSQGASAARYLFNSAFMGRRGSVNVHDL